MYFFLIPLVAGFVSNIASAFTTAYSKKWGKQTGTFLTIILRDILGIPVWAIGFVLAIREPSALLYDSSLLSQIFGWLIITAGSIIIIIALLTLRLKAAAPSTEDKLVDTAIYSIVRHPIHTGTALEFVGLFVLWPTLIVGISVIIGFVWIYLQTSLEERDLIRRIPEYRKYMFKVPGFFPKIRKEK
jgi:protein-S-isoprenylcysteine O-methyltransferase Ste14